MHAALRVAMTGRGVVPLPALPLANGARIMAFGHSFVGNGVVQTYLAGQTATNGHQGGYAIGAGVLNWVADQDGRFNGDIIPDLNNPYFPPSGLAAFTGMQQGKAGDTLAPIDSLPSLIGMITRAPYCIARGPAIVVIEAGVNDIYRGLTLEQIVAQFSALIDLFTNAGIYVIVRTLSWNSFLGAPGSAGQVMLDQLNAWIVAQAGRRGVTVFNTLVIDGPGSGIDAQAAIMFPDGLHPSGRLGRILANALLPVLQGYVSAGERRNLDALSANLFPFAGTPGTVGTKSGAVVTGNVATGMTVASTSASAVVCSKEVIAAGNEKQVLTITPNNNGTVLHTATIRTSALVTLASLGLVQGDWLDVMMTVDLDDWAGWDIPVSSPRGPAFLECGLYNVASRVFYTGSGVAGRNGTFVLHAKLWWPPGLTADALRLNTALFTLSWASNVGGVGVARVGSLILRKIADPRPAWNL